MIGAKFGIVKNKGDVNIYSEKSILHQRRESGVEMQTIGWIDNAAMKLLYFLENAKEVSELVEADMFLNKVLLQGVEVAKENLNIFKKYSIRKTKRCFHIVLERW